MRQYVETLWAVLAGKRVHHVFPSREHAEKEYRAALKLIRSRGRGE